MKLIYEEQHFHNNTICCGEKHFLTHLMKPR